MNKIFLSLLVIGLTMACGVQSDETQVPTTKSGLDLANFDTSVRPQDDFYRYVNGKWLDSYQLPEDKTSFGSFNELRDLSQERLKAIIDEASKVKAEAGSDQQMIGDFYTAYMDTETIEKRGLEPLTANLTEIDNVKTRKDLVKLSVSFLKHGGALPFSIRVSIDARDSNSNIIYVSQGRQGLPDRSYYLRDEEKYATIREQYIAHMTKMFTLAGLDDAASQAQRVFNLEKRIAEFQWTRAESRNRDKTYNKHSLTDLSKIAPGFDWAGLIEEISGQQGDVIVRQPSFITDIAKAFGDADLEAWKSYYRWGLLRTNAVYLPKALEEAAFDFYGKTLRGTPAMQPRWKRGVNNTESALGFLLGKVFVEKHFPPEAKDRMEELVTNLKTAFGKRIDGLDWMSVETKKAAHEKLAKFRAKIGYPEKWRSYDGLVVKADDLYGNISRARLFGFEENMARLGKPVDRDEWFMTPQTVNAYYSPSLNEIVFPAAILQPPFFDLNADMAVNYGGIGAVIGHEISHGFDDQGRKSDGDGNMRDWWSASDGKEFEARANQMVSQYEQYQPLEGENINGRLTLGENIGDLGGLTVAFHAYKHSLNGQPSPKLDGYTGEQRVFMGWARVWRRKMRDEALQSMLATNTHSPGEYRVTGVVANMPEFYDAFDLKEGDALFRPEEERITIW